MPAAHLFRFAIAALAVLAIVVVASAIIRQFRETRALRRELDRYLEWLLEDATRPGGTYDARPWPSWRHTT